ncbi:Blp family class II bacteriocin, partial [Staphylococcus aureus]|nr:Blp family class II bacteriocin [Staphylococcus aureus]
MKKLKIEELKKFNGGNKWGSSAIGAMGGAATGIKLCSAGGPWAMAGCGVVGGAIG